MVIKPNRLAKSNNHQLFYLSLLQVVIPQNIEINLGNVSEARDLIEDDTSNHIKELIRSID
jgi:hypothetical protein